MRFRTDSFHAPASCLLALGFCAVAPVQAQHLESATTRAVDGVFAAYDSDQTPGCALTVLDQDEVVYGGVYGMADLEHGLPITARSVFRTGSVSKQFTAAVVVLLAEEGVLSLDDPVRKYLPELPGITDDITLRHLLHHTSGIRDYLDLMALAGRGSDDFYRKEQALDLLVRQRALNFPTGTQFVYSNSGYFLLSQVVERATGRTLRQEAQERIFGPLGMTRTHFHDDRNEIVVDRADGYAPLEGGGYEISMTKLDLVGDGGVFTSADDLALWLAHLDGEQAAGSAFMNTMLARGSLADGTTLRYAMGLGHGTYRGMRYVGHGGSFVGFRAATVQFPAARASFGVLCNRADADAMGLALEVAGVVLDGRMDSPEPPRSEPDEDAGEAEPPPSVPDGSVEELVGTYFSPELDATYDIRTEGEGLVVEVDGIRTLRLSYQEPDVYRAMFTTLRFHREAGRVVGLGATLPRASAIEFVRR
ncbi:MAG TPA: serine hydrolase domain-containing protein [Longimicrobiales bacterium]|nr:serine hydrolase domain-containing protein [Longimicrobiales bacterium]